MLELDFLRSPEVTAESLIAAQISQVNSLLADVPGWSTALASAHVKYTPTAHGDQPRWLDALNRLLVEGSSEPALRQFMPWRKGPWDLGEVKITTEWRSDWKWDRLLPHIESFAGRRVLDVGCGNGYFGWQMRKAGAIAVVGIDPTLLYCMQHLAIVAMQGADNNWVLPLALEDLPLAPCFDTVLSMGVIYHRREPTDHVRRLFECTKSGGEVVLESLVVAGDRPLYPEDRYARMRNVHVVPTTRQLTDWLAGAGFRNPRIVDVTRTSIQEQQSTTWMQFESLAQALDPNDSSRTIEGHPAPVRAIAIARKP